MSEQNVRKIKKTSKNPTEIKDSMVCLCPSKCDPSVKSILGRYEQNFHAMNLYVQGQER